MAERIIDCGGGFWNVRISFRLFGLIDIGAQVSLVQLGDGGFVILDSASFGPDLQARVDAITGGRENVLAVVNTHPFHTVHTVAMHEAYPDALHFGTIRHRRLFPDLAWAETISEDPVTWAYFSPALAFTVPAGVELVPKNERVHCGAVLAWHEGSRTIHVDDTFNARPAGAFGRAARLTVHPMLRRALEPRPGAAADFRTWGEVLLHRWSDPRWICTAHTAALAAGDLDGGVEGAMRRALGRVEPVLKRHAARYG